MITDNGDRIYAEWSRDRIQSCSQRSNDFSLLGNSSLIAVKFSDGREYFGEHLDFEQYHGYGVETVISSDGAYSWRGEVNYSAFILKTAELLMAVGSPKENKRYSNRPRIW
jgi:hypothetical protein